MYFYIMRIHNIHDTHTYIILYLYIHTVYTHTHIYIYMLVWNVTCAYAYAELIALLYYLVEGGRRVVSVLG